MQQIFEYSKFNQIQFDYDQEKRDQEQLDLGELSKMIQYFKGKGSKLSKKCVEVVDNYKECNMNVLVERLMENSAYN